MLKKHPVVLFNDEQKLDYHFSALRNLDSEKHHAHKNIDTWLGDME